MTETYPSVETSDVKAEAPEALPDDVVEYPSSAVVIQFGGKKAVIDVSFAITVDDVSKTLLCIFELSSTSRIVVKRSSDGAVVVPGPKLPPGEYTLEVIDGPVNKFFKSVRETHYPAIKKDVAEKHLPLVLNTSRVGVQKMVEVFSSVKQKAGSGMSVAGTHVSRGLTVASTHVGGALTTAGVHTRGQLRRMTNIATEHSTVNSHTWTAKFWSGLVRCAPGPISYITGIPTEELLKVEGNDVATSSLTEGVPVSRPAIST